MGIHIVNFAFMGFFETYHDMTIKLNTKFPL